MRLLLVSGSSRSGSTNAAMLRTVASQVAGRGDEAVLFEGLTDLPHFNPDDDREPLHPAAADLRRRIAAADAIVFCTPEYAGGLPGPFKNLLDWTVGGGEIYEKPVAWINVSSIAAPTGGADAHASLAKVLGYVAADIVTPACVRIPLARSDVGADGIIHDPAITARVGAALQALVDHLGATAGAGGPTPR